MFNFYLKNQNLVTTVCDQKLFYFHQKEYSFNSKGIRISGPEKGIRETVLKRPTQTRQVIRTLDLGQTFPLIGMGQNKIKWSEFYSKPIA